MNIYQALVDKHLLQEFPPVAGSAGVGVKALGVCLRVQRIAMPATSATGTKLSFNKTYRGYRSEGVKSTPDGHLEICISNATAAW